MIAYIKAADGGLTTAPPEKAGTPFLAVLSAEEFHQNRERFSHDRELLHSLGSIRYCRAEPFRDCVMGILRLPRKNSQRTPLLTFAFCLTADCLCLIEDSGDLRQWAEKQTAALQDLQSPDHLLLQLMEQMIEEDILYLSHLEQELEQMEDSLNQNVPEDFFAVLTRRRQKLSELNAYYEQLTAIGELMQSRDAGAAGLWEQYTHRTERLQSYVRLLRENILQLRELYQSLQDARQNRIMGILTVVTTLFLPLTLLTGWYGMNFSHMPELQWRYGYPVVLIIAVLVVIVEIIYFKRKKFF